MRLVSVAIAAWRASEYIEESIASIRGQDVPGWTLDLRIGVDACEETAATLKALREPFWWSDENVGPYLIRNSLIERFPAHIYGTWDADDVMLPGCLRRLVRIADRYRGLAGSRRAVDSSVLEGNRNVKWLRWGGGVCLFHREAWTRLGGFRPTRIAADQDFHIRARKLGIPVHTALGARFYHRRHPGQLTDHPDSGMHTDRRRTLKLEHKRLRQSGDLYVPPETVPLTYITP